MLGKVKKFFAGGNTGYGFFSLYDNIIEPDANAIFILKGGPGVGKSSFMRWIAQQMRERGYDIEEHYCSSDNQSLDGVKIPALRVALLDGTSPHVVDPKNPGAVDTIVHLGDFWREEGIRENKEAILPAIYTNSFLFRRAYGYLRVAKSYNDELEAYIRETKALDLAGLNHVALDIIALLDCAPAKNVVGKERHLFASAITPQGLTNHLSTVVGQLHRRVLIQGRPGTGRTTIVQKVMQAAIERGFDIEAYHCALDPQRIDHVVIPELSLAVMNASEPHTFHACSNDWLIDTKQFVDLKKLAPYDDDLIRLGQRYHEALDSAICFIARAKKNHDKIEDYYIPHMDFAAVGKKREEVLRRILQFGEHKA